MTVSFQQNVRAAQLESAIGWLNTDGPLRIGHELQGQIVLLDFWTFCCINCIHILPDLKYLERKYADQPFLVIGVHSAKFPHEAIRENILAAVHRYEITHPVVIDHDMTIWKAYGARSWPTYVLIDPQGYVAFNAAGEGRRHILDDAVQRLFDHHRSTGTLAPAPLTVRLEPPSATSTGLAFPGKVLADCDNRRVIIADSNHNRIVVAGWPDDAGNCECLQIIGSGDVGASDGPPHLATFDHPQGLALAGDTLYVADTENHTVRAIVLDSKSPVRWHVTTVVGTGQMGQDLAGGGMGTQQPINSPWDLCMEGGTLYVAMAGTHQIWRVEMPIAFARALAGTGRENIVDGPVESAALSQPSGVCLLGGCLYIADSEVSAIRKIDLATEMVSTIMGLGLFVYGDVDGKHPDARLQHPLGVTVWMDKLLVADSYNHKIKIIDPADRSATTRYGTGQPGISTADGRLQLSEPGGLHAAGDRLFIADTNNHRVVMVNLKSHRWSALNILGLTAPRRSFEAPAESSRVASAIAPDDDDASRVVEIARDADITLRIHVALPESAHLNRDAPFTARVKAGQQLLVQTRVLAAAFPIELTVPASLVSDGSKWNVSVDFVYCTEANAAACVPAEHTWTIHVRCRAAGATTIELCGSLNEHSNGS